MITRITGRAEPRARRGGAPSGRGVRVSGAGAGVHPPHGAEPRRQGTDLLHQPLLRRQPDAGQGGAPADRLPSEAELDFFELFCTVDKVGVRKALKAMVRPIKEIADAIQRQDAKWLTTLPGVGRRHRREDHRHPSPQGDALRPDARRPHERDRRRPWSRHAGGGRRRQRARRCLPGVDERRTESRTRRAIGSTRSWPAARASPAVEEVLLEIYKQVGNALGALRASRRFSWPEKRSSRPEAAPRIARSAMPPCGRAGSAKSSARRRWCSD